MEKFVNTADHAKRAEEERKRRKAASLRGEISALEEKLERLRHEYCVKESERKNAAGLYLEKSKVLERMQAVKNNRTFLKAADEMSSQTAGANASSLISCYDGVMAAIQGEMGRIRQKIADKRTELAGL